MRNSEHGMKGTGAKNSKVGVRRNRTGAIVIIGLFFNVFLPGLVGGDVMRLYYIFRLAPEAKLPGSLSIVMDRLLGLLAIVFLIAIVLVARFNWLTQGPETARLVYLA